MDAVLELIGRSGPLLEADIAGHQAEISERVENAKCLVIGGAGSIGAAVVKELFARNPRMLHIVDISENNMVELVRDIRSSYGYGSGEFATFAIDCGTEIFDAFMDAQRRSHGGYDYIFNLSALKHVRSEKDAYTLMRMADVNIFNTEKTACMARDMGAAKYFCVSTDKAAGPVNMMGASKRIMEMFLMRRSLEIPVSMARFANVAFSDGSLLYGFNRRIEKNQPISAPHDVKRYFITPKEAGELCLMSALLGENRDIFFPKPGQGLHLTTFSGIAERYLEKLGYEPVMCGTEDEARKRVDELKQKRRYPVYFFRSDTTGEKDFEEFYTGQEELDMARFEALGVIKNPPDYDHERLERFAGGIMDLKKRGMWAREDIIHLFNETLPNFAHKETGRFLDGRM